jgi:hypothetical protein
MTQDISAPEQDDVPVDFTLLVPDDWFRIRLGEPDQERDSDALVRRLVAHRPDADSLAPQVRSLVRNACLKALSDPHAVEVYLSFTRVGGFPVAASLAVGVLPPGMGLDEDDVRARLRSVWTKRGEVDEVETETGRVLRLRHSVRSPLGEGEVDNLVTQYAFVVPGSTGCVVLSFGSPLVRLAEEMNAVFDAVAGTLRWVREQR